MEFIFELLFELLASGTVEASKNKKCLTYKKLFNSVYCCFLCRFHWSNYFYRNIMHQREYIN